ncbi:cell division protein ZapE [Microbacteriaceae bacterium SG_E_30_P1]|uniref:Cell division protein ZapE n=1 Tax=Antiquaquibacter oligotrophicus TaxID=2880260 RepID=A0ABT6KLX7_9MICO|nr:cell division protein ZapE [Antiquaquibacter oligotrophicus]MDH6181021.1 cell division protein ZapE [Antiquaquibacter oligotrophicus]UDF13280.1 cell division protein ZapE [Antiquaquibacter oligotrophicus]
MTVPHQTAPTRLVDRLPELSGDQMVAQLVPPPQFAGATLESYRPDRDYPSQGAAVAAVRAFATGGGAGGGLFSRRKPVAKPGIYLDGGFGVGKTHLLAALWSMVKGRKYFGTFIEYTSLVGALGYARAVELFRGASLLCIDEFELDDPGDTRLMARLLGELVASGTRIAATSNTPPNALGEGRFAAQDFLREIDSLAAKFETLRIDGLDYRRRSTDAHATVSADVSEDLAAVSGATTLDDFTELLAHLARVHPSRYVALVDGLSAIGLTGVHELTSQTDALRFVAFVDRLYDAQVRVIADGVALDAIFPEEMLSGGYRKKYLRATSRLVALTNIDA